jgi:hypothetical protein
MADINSSLPVKTEADVDERLQSKIVDFTTPTQGMEVDSDGDAHVKAKLRDDAGNPFGTESNPVFTVGAEDPGDEVEDYQTTAAVAKDASTNHDYTVTAAKTFKAASLFVSASGEFKVELQKETAPASGIYNTKYVGFAQASRPFIHFDLKKIFKQVATAKIRVKITNKDNTQDVYSTLVGVEV